MLKLAPTMMYIFVSYFDVTCVLLMTYQEEISMRLAKLVRDVSELCGVGMSPLLLVGRKRKSACVCWGKHLQLNCHWNTEIAVRLSRTPSIHFKLLCKPCNQYKTLPT